MSFPNFFGNSAAAQALQKMLSEERIAQTILLSGPEGVGKATLARRFAAQLIGDAAKLEQDDLSSGTNLAVLEERDKWTSDKRADDPLLFSSHPDFTTFAPDGPLRQISIQQMRVLRERAQLKPLRGSHRIFLIDHLDRANEQGANSLLKVLEEPPEHVIIFATVENLYDLLPTIRSRSIILQLARLSDQEMQSFAESRHLPDMRDRIAIAEGSPGLAATIDLQSFRDRRDLMLTALETGSGLKRFADWVGKSEPFSMRKSEKLEAYLKAAYSVLEDTLRAFCGHPISANRDAEARIRQLAGRVTFAWIERAARVLDELVLMVRRNVQKTAALDAMIVSLRRT